MEFTVCFLEAGKFSGGALVQYTPVEVNTEKL